jgi:hypothetical protein
MPSATNDTLRSGMLLSSFVALGGVGALVAISGQGVPRRRGGVPVLE